jgi:nitroimidazol reductase NimA-like FMN-containing flavoprotein (pyridoxamine 5'-phosphate oxidase superfamily)
VVGSTEILPGNFSTKYESVIIFGKASEVYDDEKREALVAILKKYSPGFMDKGMEYLKTDSCKTKVIKIEIEHVTGKSSNN